MKSRCLLVVLLVIGLSSCGLVSGQDSPSHTLTISSNGNGTASYVVTSSGSLRFNSEESSEYIRGTKQAAGTVGEGNDEKDVIKYGGYIKSFDYEGDLTVYLNGREISPEVLDANHIKIVHPTNASEYIEYYYPLENGESALGEYAEEDDSATDMQILGSIDTGVDSFYYRGTIPDHAFQGLAPVYVNGELVREQGPQQSTLTTTTKKTQQPMPTTTPTPSKSTATTATTSTHDTNSRPTVTVANTQPQPSESDNGYLENFSTFIVGIIGGIAIISLIGFGLVLAAR